MLNSFGETSYAQIDMELLKKIKMIEWVVKFGMF